MCENDAGGSGTVADTSIYRDIAERTHGDVYIGVVGPVRTGKSTFIKRFMEEVVLPNIPDEGDRIRARDEMPQSAGGRTVMTTEPKFIPDGGVNIRVDGAEMRVRLADCVGYMIPGAMGGTEEGEVRMVRTPWHEEPVPFEEAAAFGTHRVIAEHATVGMLVTTDGTVGDLPRESYTAAEERVAAELTELGKPFAVILNSSRPDAPESAALAERLEEKYGAPVALVSCAELDADDFQHILGMLADEFPAREAVVVLPEWTAALPEDHRVRTALRDAVRTAAGKLKKLADARGSFARILAAEADRLLLPAGEGGGAETAVLSADAGVGLAELKLTLPDRLYYDTVSELTGIPMTGEEELLGALTRLAAESGELSRYREAIDAVNRDGYGIVMPEADSLELHEPEIIRQGGGWGVRLRATAPSIHMIRADIDAEISPIVGTEQQSEETVKQLMEDFERDPSGLWESNMFGRTLYDLLNDGLHAKLEHMPPDARRKFGETLSKIINEGSQGLICIIL